VIERMGVDFHPNIRILEFLNRMDLAYAAADVIISRAGAGTIYLYPRGLQPHQNFHRRYFIH